MSFIRLTFIPYSTSAAGGPTRYIVWRPALPSGGDFVQTWAEVAAHIAATAGDIVVAVQGAAVIPAGVDEECFGRVVFQAYTSNIASGSDIFVTDGSRLRNLFTLRGALNLHGAPTTVPFLLQDVAGTILIAREGGQITLDPGATEAAIDLAANFVEIASFEGAAYNNNAGNPAVSIAQIEPGLTVIDARIAVAGTSGPPGYSASTFAGDATTVLLQIYDASAEPVTQLNFAGTAVALPMDYASGVVYNDSTVPVPSLGVNTVQAAIDVLKVQVAAAVSITYRASFTDVDLVLGILSVNHLLGSRFNLVAWYDNAGIYVLPENVTDINASTLTADFSTFQLVYGGAIPGTWTVVVSS